jgi:hypothetical protein
MHTLRCSLTLALIAAALMGTAHAQTLYESVDRQGRLCATGCAWRAGAAHNGQRVNGFSAPSYDAVFAKRP